MVNFVEAMLEDAESEEETDCEYYENDASTEHANLAGAWDWDTHLCFLLLYLCVVWGLTEGRMMRSGEEGRWRRIDALNCSFFIRIWWPTRPV